MGIAGVTQLGSHQHREMDMERFHNISLSIDNTLLVQTESCPNTKLGYTEMFPELGYRNVETKKIACYVLATPEQQLETDNLPYMSYCMI